MESDNLHNQNASQQPESKAPFREFGGKNPYKQGGMFEGASHLIFANAKHLRKNMTDAESVLWMYLKTGISGFKFRRQHPIGLFIADFYCHKAKLVVEVDGSVHNDPVVKENDAARQKELETWGYTVIRLANEEVLLKTELVIKALTEKISHLNNLHKQNTPEKTESKSPL